MIIFDMYRVSHVLGLSYIVFLYRMKNRFSNKPILDPIERFFEKTVLDLIPISNPIPNHLITSNSERLGDGEIANSLSAWHLLPLIRLMILMLMLKQIWFDFEFEFDVNVVIDHVLSVITVFAK